MPPLLIPAVSLTLTLLLLSPLRSAEDRLSLEEPDGAVIGLSLGGRHRAYPLRHFSSPTVVNDRIRRQEVAVFHDPESGLSAAYFRIVLGEAIEFSGSVRGTVADDMTTITRWDMSSGKAVGGNLLGMELVPLRLTSTSWGKWYADHPDTTLFEPNAH